MSLLTVKQAAERLGLSESKVYALVKRLDGQGRPLLGHYRPIPGSRTIRFGEHHLEAFLAAGERRASDSPILVPARSRTARKYRFVSLD